MKIKTKKILYFISGIFSFLLSIVFLWFYMFNSWNIGSKNYTGAVLADEEMQGYIYIAIAVGLLISGTFCVCRGVLIKDSDGEGS